MSRWILVRKFLLAAVIANCAALLLAPAALAWAEPVLHVDYCSGEDPKVVITGNALGLDSERVYTQEELQALGPVKTYYFSVIQPGFKQEYHTVSGISMWEVFKDAHILEDVYRHSENYLYTVSRGGKSVGIGEGEYLKNDNDAIVGETGTLKDERYTHESISAFIDFDDTAMEPMPWVLGFAEGVYKIIDEYSLGPPASPNSTSNALAAYFGQTDLIQYNGTLLNSHVYRIVLSAKQLTKEQGRNSSEKKDFSLLGTFYDRANIMSGPAGEAEIIKGRFESGGTTEYIAGTSVNSLLPTAAAEAYVAFSYGEGKQLVIPRADIVADKYTLVYATGDTADNLRAIERQVGAEKYYFDLYRDGAKPIKNVTGMALSGPPQEEVVLSIYQGSNLLKEFKDADINALQLLSNLSYAAVSGAGRLEYRGVSGVAVAALLDTAGINNLDEIISIRLQNSRGEESVFTAGQLLMQPRYYFGAGSNRSAMPAIISFDHADDDGRLYIGQAANQEPTAYALLEQMRGGKIIIGGLAGNHDKPEAQPKSGAIQQGQKIRLSGAVGQAKIYYTLDGSEPTLDSAIYQDSTLIAAPSSQEFTLKAKISGFGKADSPVADFVYNSNTAGPAGPANPGNPAGNPGGNDSGSESGQFGGGGNSSGSSAGGMAAAPNNQPAAGNSEVQSAEQALRRETGFIDVKESDYFNDSLHYAVERGLFNGYRDGSFRPQAVLSRAMAAMVLWRLAEGPEGGPHHFADMPAGAYYDAAVAWAVEAAVILGYDENRFGPEDPVSREQFVLMLYRYAAGLCYVSGKAADLPLYKDAAAISAYAREAMAWAVEIGLIKGVSADMLEPQTPLNRAQAAVILHRFCLWLESR